jgi:uncharacterized protein YegP (UPF0339 family)
MSKLTIEKYVDRAGEHRCRIKASNGEDLLKSSEGYKDERDLDRMIELAQYELAAAEIVEL